MLTILPFQARSLAETIDSYLEAAVTERGRASLAIPGGRSPGPVLHELAGLLSDYVRARLHLFWVDERAVPVGHADRNDAAMLAAWQTGGELPAGVHAMPAEVEDLEQAAEAYAATLAEHCSGVVDVCLLGIGEDGHIASLFPEHPGLHELSPVFAVTDSPKPPPRRLTVGLPVLISARQRLVLALGADKGRVARAVQAQTASSACPVSLLPAAGTAWYLDEAASKAFRD